MVNNPIDPKLVYNQENRKQKSMRSILADIWKMNEGKSPFEKDEGFASDAQRRAAFASGYKAKGKDKKEEVLDENEEGLKKIGRASCRERV